MINTDKSHLKEIIWAGKAITEAQKVLILLHGRGASAEDILTLTPHLQVEDFALLAPQATNATWYPYSFLAPPSQNQPWLSSALTLIENIVSEINMHGIPSGNIYLLGFSQGACLTLEFVARHAKQYGGIVAFTGGLIGDRVYEQNYAGDFQGTPIFIGTSDPDPHVHVSRVQESASLLKKMNADVTVKIYNNMGHTINEDELKLANQLVFSPQ